MGKAGLRPATGSDDPAVVRILVEAFAGDPLFRALWPDPADYDAAAPEWFAADVDQLRRHGTFWLTEDGAGLACWVDAAEVAGPGEFDELQAIVDRTAGPRGAGAMAALEAAESIVLPGDRRTCVYLAVRPAEQGRGIGGALLRAGLAPADRRGRPVHLVTANPRTLPFYERSGFRILAAVRPQAGLPPLWSLWRDPHR